MQLKPEELRFDPSVLSRNMTIRLQQLDTQLANLLVWQRELLPQHDALKQELTDLDVKLTRDLDVDHSKRREREELIEGLKQLEQGVSGDLATTGGTIPRLAFLHGRPGLEATALTLERLHAARAE